MRALATQSKNIAFASCIAIPLIGTLILSACTITPERPQEMASKGYLLDSYGNVVTSGYGTCIRTNDWMANTPSKCASESPVMVHGDPAPRTALPPGYPKAAVDPPPVHRFKITGPPRPDDYKAKLEIRNLAFDQDNISMNEFRRIDVFMNEFRTANDRRQAVTINALVVTGFTDSIGKPAYNTALSERRAKHVAEYLINVLKVDGERVFTEGKGAREQIAETKYCSTKVPRNQQIACLAPNRRIVIEVFGTAFPAQRFK